MKWNQKPNNHKNCTAMQNTEGQKRYLKWLRGKGRSTNQYNSTMYNVMLRLEQVPKDVVQKQAGGKWQ